MSEQKIKISEFIDDELQKNEAVDLLMNIGQQTKLDETLSRYQLISQVIKTEEYSLVDTDFSQRVRDAIEQQPTVLSPQKRKLHNNGFRFAFAVAASIAVITVIANGVMNAQTSQVRPLLIMTQQQTVNKIALNQAPVVEKKPSTSVAVIESDDSGFEDYLQAHRGSLYASQAYAQLASNE